MPLPTLRAGNQPVPQPKPQITAAQQALLDRKVLPISTLAHGECYIGYLDSVMTVARWHSQRRRFVFWDREMQQPKAKAVPHAADQGIGPRFAPLARHEPEPGAEVSEFAFVTTW